MAKVSRFTIEFTSTLDEDTVPPSIASRIANLSPEEWDNLQKLALKEMLTKHALPLVNKDNTWAKIELSNA